MVLHVARVYRAVQKLHRGLFLAANRPRSTRTGRTRGGDTPMSGPQRAATARVALLLAALVGADIWIYLRLLRGPRTCPACRRPRHRGQPCDWSETVSTGNENG